jgi:uncharacterized membrane protein (UPF0127 family)
VRCASYVDGRGNRWEVEVPTTRWERMRGLIGRVSVPPGRALVLENARSVHTFGMRFTIDAVFLDAELRVVAVRRVPPGRIALPRRGVRQVLECHEGSGLRVGDRLREIS